MSKSLTIDDWLAEFQAILAKPSALGGGYSLVEIMERTGKNRDAVRSMLRRAATLGRLSCTKEYRTSLDGSLRPIPLYRIGNAKKNGR